MSKLLRSNFSRLWKNRIFWLCSGFVCVCSAAYMLNAAFDQTEYYLNIDNYYFQLVPFLGLFIAVFTSLFLGTEYNDGTIRNKLIIGHTRADIYLANWIVCFTAGLFFLAAWLVSSLVGIPFFGLWKIGIPGLLTYIGIAVFFTAALTGIMVLLSTLLTNRAAAQVVAVLLFLGLMLLALNAYGRLWEPEFYNGIMIMADGVPTYYDPQPNPRYVSGAARILLEWIMDILPTGQGILMATQEISHPIREIICSVLIASGTTFFGILAFRKKDLK